MKGKSKGTFTFNHATAAPRTRLARLKVNVPFDLKVNVPFISL